jgi:general secretion pathway protein M
MREWFDKLEPRERLVLVVGVAISLLVLLYAGVWYPLERDVHRLQQSVLDQRATVAWMRQAAQEVKQLRSSGEHRQVSTAPLLTLVEQSARQAGLGSTLSRIEPQGESQARVWLEEAPFDAMVRWLGQVRQSQGLTVESIVLDPQKDAGLVNARLVLERGGAG